MIEYFILSAIAAYITRFIYNRYGNTIKGNVFERKVTRELNKLRVPGKKVVMHNTLLPTSRLSSQLDALVITRSGLIVVEAKKRFGKIYGDLSNRKWVVVSGKKESGMPSPVSQNKSHVIALNDALQDKFPNIPYFPVVVFSDDAELHVQNSRNLVCNLSALNNTVERQLGPEVFTDAQVKEIAKTLDEVRLKRRSDYRNHVIAIKAKEEARRNYDPELAQETQDYYFNKARSMPKITRQQEPPEVEVDLSSDLEPMSSDNRPLFEILADAKTRREAETLSSEQHPTSSKDLPR